MNETNETKPIPEERKSIFKKPWMQSIIAIVIVFGLLTGFLYWQSKKNTVFVENSRLSAPVVTLAAPAGGTLNVLYVHSGDVIEPNTQVALVGTNVVTAKESGTIAATPEALGGYYAPGQSIATLITTSRMKVVGDVEETKGLSDLAVGQRATFTVDAFPGKTYTGFVDEVGATSETTGVTFSISDKRPTEKFEVKVRFDTMLYPELKNGMSAKITVHTK